MVFAGLQTTEKLLEPNLINVFDSSIIFLLTFDCLGGIAKSLREIKWEICARVWACTVYFCAACSLYLYQWGCEWAIVTNKGIKSQLRMQTGATFSTVCCSQLSDEIWNTNTTALLALLCLPSWAEPGQNSSFFFTSLLQHLPPTLFALQPTPDQSEWTFGIPDKVKTTCLDEWKAKAMGAGCEAGVKAPVVWPWVDKS